MRIFGLFSAGYGLKNDNISIVKVLPSVVKCNQHRVKPYFNMVIKCVYDRCLEMNEESNFFMNLKHYF